MKEALQSWAMQRLTFEPVLAFGLLFRDRSAFTQCALPDYTEEALKTAWSDVNDFFEVANLHHLPAAVICWRFEHAQLHAVRHIDGPLLCVLLPADAAEADVERLETHLAEFANLRPAPPKTPETKPVSPA